MIKGLRLSTVSFETKAITLTIFFAQFTNTALLLTLKNFNTVDIFGHDSQLSAIFDGKDSDFGTHWYKTVGVAMTTTMMIQAFTPLIQFATDFSILNVLRCADRRFTWDRRITRQASVKNYVDLHAGPEFALNNRFSAILLMISVTCLFGAALPVLYIIGFVSFSIMIVVEKLQLCYFYREPPMYDESITRTSNFVIKVIVYIGLFLSSWELGNRQIFESVTGQPLILQTDVPKSGHSLKEALAAFNPFHMTYNSPPLIVFIALIAYEVAKFTYGRLRRLFKKKPVESVVQPKSNHL